MLDVALEVPLAALGVGRFLQRDDPRTPRVQVLHQALDRAALAGRVAALEQDHHTLAGLLHPGLQLEQLDLQAVFLLLVVAPLHQVAVRVAAFAPVGREFFVGIGASVEVLRARPEQCLAQRTRLVVGEAGQQRLDGSRQRGPAARALVRDDVPHRADARLLLGFYRARDGVTLDALRIETRRDISGSRLARRACPLRTRLGRLLAGACRCRLGGPGRCAGRPLRDGRVPRPCITCPSVRRGLAGCGTWLCSRHDGKGSAASHGQVSRRSMVLGRRGTIKRPHAPPGYEGVR